MKSIYLNCDLGEGTGNDIKLMSYISSCSIACGGHFGNATTIQRTLELAQIYEVSAGAHPSFEDQQHFGRVFIDISRSRFRESVTKQINLFQEIVQQMGMSMDHIKMHGALYHATAYREDFSDWLVELMIESYPDKMLYVPPQSLLKEKCRSEGILFKNEAFADRRYNTMGELLSRSQKGALITDINEVLAQLDSMAHENKVVALGGKKIPLEMDTICIHGDNEIVVHQFEKLIHDLRRKNIAIV